MNTFKISWDANGDDEFFDTLDRTNLGEVFVKESSAENLEHRSLKYKQQIPQQSKNETQKNNNGKPQIWNTQLAKVANGYKEGQLVGKVGVALLKSNEKTCKIIIYKAKSNVLSTFTLSAENDCKLLHRQCRYLQFYDDDGLYWSLLFDKKEDEQEFLVKLHELNITVLRESIVKSTFSKNINEDTDVEISDIINDSKNLSEGKSSESSQSDSPQKRPSKSSLISRVSKVGQQLPNMTPNIIPMVSKPQISDDDIETDKDSDKERIICTPKVFIGSTKPQQIVPINTIDVFSASDPSQPAININQMETKFMQMMLSENRTQNSELRMSLTKLDSKVDKVLDKFINLDNFKQQQSKSQQDLFDMEEKLLELKKENRKLKLAVEEEENTCFDKVKKRFFKQYKEDLDILGVGDINDMECLFETLISKTKTLQKTSEQKDSSLEDYSKQMQLKDQKLDEEKGKNLKLKEKVSELEQVIITSHQALSEKTREATSLQEKLYSNSDISTIPLSVQKDHIEHTLKSIMNKLYSTLLAKIEQIPTRRKNEIFAIIGETIRSETLKALDDIEL